MKSSSSELTKEKEKEKEKEKTYQQYIPVYKKGYHSKTYHPKSKNTPLSPQYLKPKHRKTYASKTQYKRFFKHYDKVLVFDLDETLGSFSELQWLWNAMVKYHDLQTSKINTQSRTHSSSYSFSSLHNQIQILNTLLEIYPEFLRPGILHILEYVARKKKRGECMAIFVYTNNQQPPPWTERIVEYFNQYIEEKTGIHPFFDQIISAFKIGQEKIEWLRTSHDKCYDDFIKCTLIPKFTEICFVDNTYYQSMTHPKVYYIQPKFYQHSLSQQDIIQRFLSDEKSELLKDYFTHTPSPTSFPSASSFLFFSNSQSQKQLRKSQIKKFIERVMDEFSKNKWLRLQQYANAKSTATMTVSQKVFDSIDVDLYVSNKMMDFIREFFVLTTYSQQHTRKNYLDHEHKTGG